MVLYGIANCDTVKRARAWLAEHEVRHEFHDFKKAGVPQARLDAWIAAVGWQTLVNRRGTMWRRLDAATQQVVVDAASACALMRSQPSVIKRPLVEWADGRISVGFDAERWAALIERQ
jgi:arsenate reductase